MSTRFVPIGGVDLGTLKRQARALGVPVPLVALALEGLRARWAETRRRQTKRGERHER
jgi:hypothetical protein